MKNVDIVKKIIDDQWDSVVKVSRRIIYLQDERKESDDVLTVLQALLENLRIICVNAVLIDMLHAGRLDNVVEAIIDRDFTGALKDKVELMLVEEKFGEPVYIGSPRWFEMVRTRYGEIEKSKTGGHGGSDGLTGIAYRD